MVNFDIFIAVSKLTDEVVGEVEKEFVVVIDVDKWPVVVI